jgi:hypothetical protein
MGISYKFRKKTGSRFKISLTLVIVFIGIIFGLSYFIFRFSNLNPWISNPTALDDSSATQGLVEADYSVDPTKGDSIKKIYPTKENGRVWSAKWSDRKKEAIESGERDPLDSQFIMRGDGGISINGDGIAELQGDAPRMYVYDSAKKKKWNNVEVTVYAKRISETKSVSYQGMVIGARSEHQDATLKKPCLGATYYGRLLYDGRAVFQKEVIHEGAYSTNKPSENNKARWNTPNGTMPENEWIGVKFIVKTNPDGKSVRLELYRDLTGGKDGGAWEKVAEYDDNGKWSQTNSGVNIKKKCGYSANKVLLQPGTSVFVRNDNIKNAQYKLFSIREID